MAADISHGGDVHGNKIVNFWSSGADRRGAVLRAGLTNCETAEMWSRFKTSTQTFVRKKYPKFTIRNLMINIDKDNAGAKSAGSSEGRCN